ncbi:MAG: PAS domain-containing hybrid sensor histidine kinase/response regulator [Desulfomonilaceae bacterium]
MEEPDKTKEQLMAELAALRQRIAELENSRFDASTTESQAPEPPGSTTWSPDELPCGYQSLDSEGRLLDVNEAWLAMTGYTREEVIGRWFGDFLSPASAERFREKFREIKASGYQDHVELDILKKDGTTLPAAFQGRIIRHADGGFKQTRCVVRDISQQKLLESQLHSVGTWFRFLVENVADAVCAHDLEGNIFFVNNVAADAAGTSPAEMTGTNLRDYLAPRAREELDEFLEKVKRDGRASGLMLVQKANGERRLLSFRNTLATDPNGTSMVIGVARDVTEQKEREKALQESERKYRLLTEMMSDMVWTTDLDFRTTYVSPSIEKLLGFSPEERYRQTLDEMVTPDSLAMIRELLAQELQKEQDGASDPNRTVTVVAEHYKKDGDTIWLEVTVRGIRDAAGKLIGIHGVSRDVTQRKQMEEALRESEARYREITENSLVGVFIHQDNVIVYVNPRMTEILGYTREEMIGRNFLGAVPKSARETVMARLAARGEGDTAPFAYELQLRKKSGEKIWCEILTTMITYQGRPAIMGNILDISERKEFLEALEASRESYKRLFNQARDQQELYQSLLNCAPDPIVVYDMEGKVRYLNPAHTRLFGWTLEEAEGKRLNTLPEWDRERALSIIRQVVYEGAVNTTHETQRLTKDGRVVDVSISAGRYLDHQGNPAGMVVVLRDISERKKMEAALREREARYKQLAEVTFEAIIFHDHGILLEANDQFFEMFGYEPEELIGKPIMEKTLTPESLQIVKEKIASGAVESYEAVGLKKDGSTFPIEIRPRQWISGGKQIRAVAIRDISERKNLERQLLHAQKMEAVGTLAGGIAHDFNNLLQAVIGFAEILMSRQQPGSRDLEDLRKIHTAGKRGADLVRNLLTFSRQVEPKKRPVDLNREVLEVHKLLSHSIPKTIQIVIRSRGHVNEIMADPSQVTQVLMNLAVNARDAMPDGGTLTIQTENVFLDDAFVNSHPEIDAGPYVLLTVSDTGHGMDKQTLERIFDPFFSTKEVGKGTGLGLATVYGIVKQHGGHIECDSEPGKGTVFRIYFPALESEEEVESAREETLPPGGTETVLLADDEDMLRELGRDVLTAFGYKVLEASHGKEALAIYRERAADISLVMLDLNMPEMDGQQCMTEILKLNPKARILVITGFQEHVIKRRVLRLGAAGVVCKPYDVRQLLVQVRETIDKSS